MFSFVFNYICNDKNFHCLLMAQQVKVPAAKPDLNLISRIHMVGAES